MNEWDFTTNVVSWINALIARNPELPFKEARAEMKSAGSAQRRDLTLVGHDGRNLLTGEFKLPDKADGGSPYNAAVVDDARGKARAAGADLFVTWNVNECVLWETDPRGDGAPGAPADYKNWRVANVRKGADVERPDVQQSIQAWLITLLRDVARALEGADVIERKAPDDKFIDAFEAALRQPVALTVEVLNDLYRKPPVKRELDGWMRELGFVLSDDPAAVRENLDAAAKHACYTLATRLVFYEGLLRRYGAGLPKIEAPAHVTTGDALRAHFAFFFAKARKVTGDYETVFGERPNDVGDRVPFYTDAVLPFWRGFVDEIHRFDFSKLDYEVVGLLFERLLSPEERHKYGQYYTRPEVVDLMLAFGMPTGEEAVMDPACGGGTFLVRAYARGRVLAPHLDHGDRLDRLYGTDVSAYAVNLTTINLATRDLVQDENYPRVGRTDFFDLATHGTIARLPRGIAAGGLGAAQARDVHVPDLDLVVGNPPYVRQEDVDRKGHYADVAGRAGASLSKRADLHAYFWPHAAQFLKDDGALCFLTSSQWLDVDYGFALQEWMLGQFEVVAVFESVDEPWFVGARVVTAATVLRRQRSEEARDANTVRFVQLRRPVAETLAHDGTAGGAVAAADAFRDEILGLTEDTVNERYRARLVLQKALRTEGTAMGALFAKDGKAGRYVNKWGRYLRAPDLWFRLVERAGPRLVPLARLAEIRRGVTSGKDEFFLPKDASAEALTEHLDAAAFRSAYYADRNDVEAGRVRILACGAGLTERRPIEARYVEPEVHNLKDVKRLAVTAADCARVIVLLPSGEALEPHAAAYVAWGESTGSHKLSTTAARESETRRWYDLRGHRPGALLWSMSQQYRHAVPRNADDLIANHNLFDLHPAGGVDPDVLAGVLNSSWTALSKFQFGRPVGNEGNLKTEVVDVKLMAVADPAQGTAAARKRVAEAFRAMQGRPQGRFVSDRAFKETALRAAGKDRELARLSDASELDAPDRHALDDAVLELLGVASADERQALRAELYTYLREFFVATRKKEEKATANRSKTNRRGRVTPQSLAQDVVSALTAHHAALLRTYDDLFDPSEPFDTYEVPARGEPRFGTADAFAAHAVTFWQNSKRVAAVPTRHEAQQRLVHHLAGHGVRPFVAAPVSETAARALHDRHAALMRDRLATVAALVDERTNDEKLAAQAREKVGQMLRA